MMGFSARLYRLLQKVEPELREVLLAILEELDRSVTREEFREFVKATEENFRRVWEAIDRLTEAQKRTEQRVEELAEAQRRTEERLNQLAVAQRRTEEQVAKLTGELIKLKDRVEGISHSVGYSLENRSYKALPPLLKRDFGIEVEGKLVRRYIKLDGKEVQLNIYGKGRRNGKEVLIIGECKVRPSKRELRKFVGRVKAIEKKEGKEVIALVVAHDFPPAIEDYLKELGLKYYWSYELE